MIGLVSCHNMAVAVGAFLAACLMVASSLIETAELQGYDFLLSMRKSASRPPDLLMIDFDSRTVAALGARGTSYWLGILLGCNFLSVCRARNSV
jgi:CHASE2 domain-containing sensor protein